MLSPSFAVGEVEALVLKAYRGADFSWGMAQEAGRAAGWLAARKLPALDAFASLLRQTVDTPHDSLGPDIKSATWPQFWSSPSGMLCPVIAGAMLSDMGSTITDKETVLTLESVVTPLILLPFAALLEIPVTIKATDLEVCCLLYTSPSPRDATLSRMPSSA